MGSAGMTSTKFCVVIKLDERKLFTGSTPALGEIFVTNADVLFVCCSLPYW